MYFFVARQPIFNTDMSLFAYELLFRNSERNVYPGIDPDIATSRMVDGITSLQDWDSLLQRQTAFINFTAEAVINELPLTLPKERIVVEILENSEPTQTLLKAVINLQQLGYRIALDDYQHKVEWEAFLPYVYMVKIETPLHTQQKLMQFCNRLQQFPHLRLLAEKVETHEQFEQAKQLGFSYFQGYFFCKPEMVKSRFLGHSSAALLYALREINKPDASAAKVAQACQGDPRLSVKLLRYVNSTLFFRSTPISSIKHAVSFLGERELRRFVYLMLTTYATSAKLTEVIKTSLARARFCELWVQRTRLTSSSDEAFLAGMLSMVEAIFDAPVETILDNIGLSDELFLVITQKQGLLGMTIRLIESIERADWPQFDELKSELKVTDDIAAQLYESSIQWAETRLQILTREAEV
ncbi:EAL and HDOD domain-containing protein [Neptunicella sp. SCSIO 80796]|uniref:EAL and HDOD domain-containing protein n=1 Tax=Neptunicella plasticusilytica TaxID=3117012 RepID=UPI003A4D4BE3